MTRYTLHSLRYCQIYGDEQDTSPLPIFLNSQISTLLVTFYNFPRQTDFPQFSQSSCLGAAFPSFASVNEVSIFFFPFTWFCRSVSTVSPLCILVRST